MKNNKKILIIILILVTLLVAIIIFFMNYDIKIVNETSNEYKKLYDISSIEYYKKNHLLAVEKLDDEINSETVNSDVLYLPDLTKYENYKPEYIDTYQNIDNKNDNKYIEMYRLYLVNDDFYKENLEEYFDIKDKVYMKVSINNMRLITSISLTKTIDGKDVYGPIMYEYYHNKN